MVLGGGGHSGHRPRVFQWQGGARGTLAVWEKARATKQEQHPQKSGALALLDLSGCNTKRGSKSCVQDIFERESTQVHEAQMHR